MFLISKNWTKITVVLHCALISRMMRSVGKLQGFVCRDLYSKVLNPVEEVWSEGPELPDVAAR